MPFSDVPVYPQETFLLDGVATLANTTLSDSPDDLVELALPSSFEAEGRQLIGLWAQPRETSTATVLRGYISLDNGTTKREFAAELAAADTVSATDAPTPVHLQYQGAKISPSNAVPLPAGAGTAKTKLYVSISVALTAGWVFHAAIQKFGKATVG